MTYPWKFHSAPIILTGEEKDEIKNDPEWLGHTKECPYTMAAGPVHFEVAVEVCHPKWAESRFITLDAEYVCRADAQDAAADLAAQLSLQ